MYYIVILFFIVYLCQKGHCDLFPGEPEFIWQLAKEWKFVPYDLLDWQLQKPNLLTDVEIHMADCFCAHSLYTMQYPAFSKYWFNIQTKKTIPWCAKGQVMPEAAADNLAANSLEKFFLWKMDHLPLHWEF